MLQEELLAPDSDSHLDSDSTSLHILVTDYFKRVGYFGLES